MALDKAHKRLEISKTVLYKSCIGRLCEPGEQQTWTKSKEGRYSG